MAKSEDVGIIKLENGMYAYRFSMLVDGKRISERKSVDQNGNKLRTVKQAIRARNIAMFNARVTRLDQPKEYDNQHEKKNIFCAAWK